MKKRPRPKTKPKGYRFPLWIGLTLAFFVIFLLQIILSPLSPSTTPSSNPVLRSNNPQPKPTSQPKKAAASQNSTPITSGYQLRVPILMYHYIGYNPDSSDKARDVLATNPDKFKQEMQYLSDQGYQTISLDTLYAALKKQLTLPSKPIVLTFDDGYEDFYTAAYPILQEFNFKATVFIPTGLMETKPYLSWPQIQLMSRQGLITFGAHTINHYSLPSISNDQSWYEISQSKKELQDRLGIPINFFAYPGGSLNNFVVSQVQQAGFVGAVGTWSSHIQSEGTIFNMPRIRINGTIDLPTFIQLL